MNMAKPGTLALAQRLEAMEVLWQSLSHDSAYNPGPIWHADVLPQRVQEIKAGYYLFLLITRARAAI